MVSLLPAAMTVPARAFEFLPYDSAVVQKMIASGKPKKRLNSWIQ